MQIIIHNRLQNPPYLISPNFPPKELDNLKEMLYNENIKYTLIYSEKEYSEYEQFFKRHN